MAEAPRTERGPLPRRCRRSSLLTALGVPWLLAVGAVDAGEPIRVMPLGDSITQGYRDSYRRPLWFRLQHAGIEVDFVGSMERGLAGDAFRDFDVDHEGHWGWRADEVLASIDSWVTTSKPDIVLLHLGTNDLGVGQAIEETIDEIGRIVTRLRRHNRRIHVLLAALIPVDNRTVTERIEAFNRGLARLAAATDTPESRIVLVDQFTGFDASTDTYDGLHPNDRGNEKIADNWFTAFQSLLNRTPAR